MADLTKEQIAALAAEKEAKEARKRELAEKREAEREQRAGESKADAFKRIGERRLNAALGAIASIGGLAAKANYDYTDEQVNTITKHLENEVIKLANRFKNPNTPANTGVTL